MVLADQPDIVVVNKQGRKAVAVDVAVQSVSYVSKKEHEKLTKYQGLKEELENMW